MEERRSANAGRRFLFCPSHLHPGRKRSFADAREASDAPMAGVGELGAERRIRDAKAGFFSRPQPPTVNEPPVF
jgi:hypothetical protein